jgi:hypothetical protein
MVWSGHEVAKYTTIHNRYDVLISRKLLYPATLWSWGVQVFLNFTVTLKYRLCPMDTLATNYPFG